MTTPILPGFALVAVATGCLLGFASEARAEGERRSVVIVVEGKDGEVIASAIAGHIEATSDVSDPHAFHAALAARGSRSLGRALTSPARDAQLVAAVRAAAAEVHIDAAILVSLRKGRRGVRLHVWAVDGQGHGTPVEEDVASGPSSSQEADAAWGAVASLFPATTSTTAPAAVADTNPAPPARPAASTADPTAQPTDTPLAPPEADHVVESSRSASATNPRAGSLVIVQPSMQAASRHFAYTDRLTGTLRPYDLTVAPRAAIEAEVYPLAHSDIPMARGLGLTGDYARAFALGSDAGGTSVGTQWQSFDVGLRERIALGSATLVGLAVGYGGIDFTFATPPFSAVLPSANYRFGRFGADVRLKVGVFSFFGGASYLSVMSTGAMGEAFPRETVGGLEASLGAAWLMSPHFELSVGAGYSRFFYNMNPVPGDANVAGGAVDEMEQLSLAFSYLL
jgi:hypothetical protein